MRQSRTAYLRERAIALWTYCSSGVWSDMRDKWWVALVKTLNLSAKSFMRRDIQSQACALTYRTLLAIVPALALLIAIGRGFGLQQMLRNELFSIFPSQHTAINYALDFVDAYLSNSSGGCLWASDLRFCCGL